MSQRKKTRSQPVNQYLSSLPSSRGEGMSLAGLFRREPPCVEMVCSRLWWVVASDCKACCRTRFFSFSSDSWASTACWITPRQKGTHQILNYIIKTDLGHRNGKIKKSIKATLRVSWMRHFALASDFERLLSSQTKHAVTQNSTKSYVSVGGAETSRVSSDWMGRWRLKQSFSWMENFSPTSDFEMLFLSQTDCAVTQKPRKATQVWGERTRRASAATWSACVTDVRVRACETCCHEC